MSEQSDWGRIESVVLKSGRDVARAHGGRMVDVFADTLAGDVARFQVARATRRQLPGAKSKEIEYVIEELLVP